MFLGDTGDFKRFQYFNFEKSFPKNKSFFFKKLRYSFLVESTVIKNATFPYKTDLCKAHVMTNRIRSTN